MKVLFADYPEKWEKKYSPAYRCRYVGRVDKRRSGHHHFRFETTIIMGIRELQARVDEWIKKYGVRYFNELTNIALLLEKAGELARVMARKYGDQSFKTGECDNTEEEIADILRVLVCIANQTRIDMEKAVLKNFEKKTNRDAQRHIRNPFV